MGFAAVARIGARGHAAVVVGGTGLYVRALLDGLDLASVPTDPVLRARIEAEAERDGADALHQRLRELDPEAAARVDRAQRPAAWCAIWRPRC